MNETQNQIQPKQIIAWAFAGYMAARVISITIKTRKTLKAIKTTSINAKALIDQMRIDQEFIEIVNYNEEL